MTWKKYLLKRGYIEKMVHKEILLARAISRGAHLEKVNNQLKLSKRTFNITYQPLFRNVRKMLEKLRVILASENGHKKVFSDIPINGFKINKNLKAHLLRSQLPDLDEISSSKSCGDKFHLCENMKDTCTFKSKHLDEIHTINKKYNCNSRMTVYFIECQICDEQFSGSTKTKFRSRANN